MSKHDSHLQEFSNDPDENLRIENEIMKLKLQAEFGGIHYGSENIPPQIENLFLKQVERFEREWCHSQSNFIKVYDFLGKPKFIKPKDLRLSEAEAQLSRILELLAEKNIQVHFLRQYHPLLKYKFLTEKLFQHEIENISVPGWTMNFIYEEFHQY